MANTSMVCFTYPRKRIKCNRLHWVSGDAALADLPTGGEGILGSACLQAVSQAAPGHALMKSDRFSVLHHPG
jgi:hypothetical protein